MRLLILVFLLSYTLFANSQNQSRMNTVKSLIQKEEYISLAVNKYILQTGNLPIVHPVNNRSLNWTLLMTDDYLGSNFNRENPFLGNNLIANFDTSNNLYILGAIETSNDFNTANNYLYNFYSNQTFRVNTLAPQSSLQTDLIAGTQVIYDSVVKDIAKLIDPTIVIDKKVILDNEDCPNNDYYHELKNGKLTYKFCRGDYAIDVYQRPPIVLENLDDLKYIKAKIGDRVFAQRNNNWYEYYYQGDLDVSWVPVESGSVLHSQDEEEDIEDRIISYIPNSKDLILRDDGGCMLANGDIFCWGNNTNKKSGIETRGQLNPNFSPDFINTPVMLKVQIDDSVSVTDGSGTSYTRRDKRWYNNPYRVKFEKMAFNGRNVCGISPIFDYFQAGVYRKFGGDIYCNGKLNSQYFEDINDVTPVEENTSILKRNKFFAEYKDDQIDDDDQNEIYLKDVAMIDGVIAVLSEAGEIFTLGSNDKGALGVDNIDELFIQSTPVSINQPNQIFKYLYALRDIKSFAAIDEYNKLWIWGERPSGTILYKPTLEDYARSFDSSRVFVNSKELILRGLDKKFYITKDSGNKVITQDITSETSSKALSISYYKMNGQDHFIYVDEDRKLKGSSTLLSCRSSNNSLCSSSTDRTVFDLSVNKLNGPSDEDGSFSNASIFQINNIDNVFLEDFESGATGWNDNTTLSGGNASNILGRFGKNFPLSSGTMQANGTEEIFKTYDFGLENANKQAIIEFDMYEIDSWDANRYSGDGGITESFIVYINEMEVARDVYKADSGRDIDTRPGTAIRISNTGSRTDEKHLYSFNINLNNQGQVKLGFGVLLGENYTNESFGIDNVKITVKDSSLAYTCAMTGLGSSSQMYCWGNVGRSIPILSTSLYDVSKIDNLNKLFITSNSEVSNEMSFSEFNNNGKLFLKYPTYIGGFDYEFYFK